MVKIINENLSDNFSVDEFMNEHYYYSPKVGLDDIPIEDLTKVRDKARKIYYKYEKQEEYKIANKYYDYVQILNTAIKKKRETSAGTYEVKKQIEADIWSCINGQDVDFDKLKELWSKYKDNLSLFNSIKKRILNKEMWYD